MLFLVSRAGVLFDRYGARYLAFFATIFLWISLLLFSISVHISEALKQLIQFDSWVVPFILITIFFFFIRFCGQGVLTMASRNMIMIWFDENKGKVNSLSSITISSGFSSSSILINNLIENYGWEISWQLLAICLFIFSFFIMQFYRNKPEDFNLKPDGYDNKTKVIEIEKDETNFILKEAKKPELFG